MTKYSIILHGGASELTPELIKYIEGSGIEQLKNYKQNLFWRKVEIFCQKDIVD